MHLRAPEDCKVAFFFSTELVKNCRLVGYDVKENSIWTFVFLDTPYMYFEIEQHYCIIIIISAGCFGSPASQPSQQEETTFLQ